MATRKRTPKTAVKTKAKAKAKAAPKSATKSAGSRKKPAQAPRKGAPAGPQRKRAQGNGNIRVRMYRVGFGDFFLLTVPGTNGPAHILIDCGVHAANIGSIDECVKDMMKETG